VAPSFSFSGDISERFTMGASIAINGGFNILMIESTASGSTTTTHISAAPDLALGGSFHLIPDHFSLHAGIGVELFSINISSASSEAGGSSNNDKTVVTRFSLPTARFGGGLTINLTKSLAVDAMAFSSGLDFDTTKFNLLLTIKK
jgi:opacity protein-like surface antigen